MNNRRSILGMTAEAGALVSMAAWVGACSGSDSNLGTEGGGGGAGCFIT